ncbi:unnamed protein product [Rhodiola kirilowii]
MPPKLKKSNEIVDKDRNPTINEFDPHFTRSKASKVKRSTSNTQETSTQTMAEGPPPPQLPQAPLQPIPQAPHAQIFLKDYVAPNAYGYRSPILVPEVDNCDFDLKTSTIQMVQSNQFSGREDEDPNSHLTSFLEICNTFRINGVFK